MKSKYDSLVAGRLDEVRAWARDGLSHQQIGQNLGVSGGSIRNYKQLHPAFAKALEEGRIADLHVENAMYKRATGYVYEETIVERKISKETGELTIASVKTIKKEMAPNLDAQKFWLANRKRDLWQYRPDAKTDASEGESGGVIVLPEVREEKTDDADDLEAAAAAT